jgi:NADPH-dependent 2,4-dienoyl-CoA reductase/sulfur reductase-like enzyme
MYGISVAVFLRRFGGGMPGGSTILEKGIARRARNYDPWRKERKVQETSRHDLRYDAVVVGGGSAGLSAALVLGRSRRRTLVLDSGEPRNAPSSGVHGFFSRDGILPEELLRIGREQLEPYPSVEVRSARVTGFGAGASTTARTATAGRFATDRSRSSTPARGRRNARPSSATGAATSCYSPTAPRT